MTTTGIIIGRFQVPYLHLGHIYLIAEALKECSKVVILLGCKKGAGLDEKNPYTPVQRMHNLWKVFPHVDIQLLEDRKEDVVWSKQVDLLCSKYFNPVLYHSRDSFVSHYSGKVPTKAVPELPGYSGTKLRAQENGSTNDDLTDPNKPWNLRVA